MKTFKELYLPKVEESALYASDMPVMKQKEKKQIHTMPHDPPAVLIMKRKTIRLFPGGKRVALYYIDKLNKYVTIPYADMQWMGGVEEEISAHDYLKALIESNVINKESTEDIFSVYNKLNEKNKEKFVQMAEEDFDSLLNFVEKNK